MIRINRETDYGIGLLGLMARSDAGRFSAAWLAEQCGLPQPMVSKILKHLVRAGVLVSYRGAKGGYGLARSPDQINVAEIVSALEGPIALTECVVEGVDACRFGSHCTVSTNWNRINEVVRQALAGITLTEMSEPGGARPDMAGSATAQPLQFKGVRYVSDH